MASSDRLYKPGKALEPVKGRKEKFAEINAYVMAKGGWITSIPGDIEVALECLPSSTLPGDLASQGWDFREVGEGERILANAVTEDVITEGSTVPIRVTHAGIVPVLRYLLMARTPQGAEDDRPGSVGR